MVGGNVSEQPGPTEGQPVAVNRVQSGVFFSSVGYLLQKSGQVTSLSFETAKSCTKLGLGVTKVRPKQGPLQLHYPRKSSAP